MSDILKESDASRIRAARQFARKHKLNWWWLDVEKWGEHRQFWFWYAAERSAFIYELTARVYGTYELKEPWNALDEVTQAKLADRWKQSPPNYWAADYCSPEIFTPEMQKPKATSFACISYNLEMNDEFLVRNFLERIKIERRAKGIYPKPNEASRRKPKPWRVLESWDIREKKLRALSHGERSQLSKAIRQLKSI